MMSHKRNFKRKYASQERSEHKTLHKQPQSWTADTLPQLLSICHRVNVIYEDYKYFFEKKKKKQVVVAWLYDSQKRFWT